MSNVRRQTVIIAVLIVLIACAGWFAKVFNDNTTGGRKNIEAVKTDAEEKKEAAAFFSQTRVGRENERSSTMEQLQAIIQSTDSTEDAKTQASAKYMELLSRGDQENEVELKVKNDGYTDALCFITDTGVELYVKVDEKMNGDQAFALQEIIVRTTGIAPSNIVIKPVDE